MTHVCSTDKISNLLTSAKIEKNTIGEILLSSGLTGESSWYGCYFSQFFEKSLGIMYQTNTSSLDLKCAFCHKHNIYATPVTQMYDAITQ